MERLLVSSSLKLTRKLWESTRTIRSFNHSLPCNTFHSLLTKPPQTHSQYPHSHYDSAKLHGFLSNTQLPKNVMKTLLLRRRIALPDSSGIAFRKCTQFPKQSFGHNPRFLSSSQNASRRSWLRWLTPNDMVWPMVLGLILANVIVFILWRVADEEFMLNNFTMSVENLKNGRLHTLVTYAFSHTGLQYLFDGMLVVFFFGKHLGHVYGPVFLLKLYLAGALSGSLFSLAHSAFKASSSKGRQLSQDPLRTPRLGASPVIYAIMLLDILLFPKSAGNLLVICLIGKDAFRMIMGEIPSTAHLGGALVPIICARKMKGRF